MKVIPSEYWASQATITPLANGSPVTPFEVVCLKFKGVYFSHQDSEAKNNLPKPAFLPGLTGAPSSWDHRSSVGCCWIFREAFTDLSLSLLCSSLALEQLLTELDDFLKVLDQENLSSAAVVKKSGLSELLRLYTKSSSKCGPEGRGLGWSSLSFPLMAP